MTIRDITHYLNTSVPTSLADPSDEGKIGLSVGDESLPLENILLALDVTKEVIEEAIQKKANLIITHHPFIYQPITKLLSTDPKTALIYTLLHHRIQCYSMHTNLDVVKGGVGDTLAHLLELENIEGIEAPSSFLRSGTIPITPLVDVIEHVKKRLALDGIRYVGQMNQRIQKIGIIGGSGGTVEAIEEAMAKGCDLLITSEIKLHIAQYAESRSFALIEVNHGVERFALIPLATDLERKFDLKNRIYVSNINTDPLQCN